VTGRGTLYLLLTVVAGAAAMLSFAALRDLALLCGFGPRLAWLLPVVVDAGAAAGSLVWLGAGSAESARRFARRLALGLLALSVAANALGHGLAAFVLLPPWWVVVILSGIAPAVLGAMVHLAVLVGRSEGRDRAPATVDEAAQIPWTDPPVMPTAGGFPRWSSPLPDADTPWPLDPCTPDGGRADGAQDPTAAGAAADGTDRVAALIAAGAGRRRLARELGVTEHEARRLLVQARPTDPPIDDVRQAAAVARATASTTAGAPS
jgi:hypothetical protein